MQFQEHLSKQPLAKTGDASVKKPEKTSDLITATGNIDFVNDSSTASAAKNVTVLVAGNGLTSADTVSGINVFE
ncbi:MAG: hypothetical protein LBT46_04910, partial [Planctomycetaceae bacterium]|nr:hypothetical protein [Planctomycetaceae bacterium]